MSLTYQQLIDLAVENAGRGLDDMAMSDFEARAESLAPLAMLKLGTIIASDPTRRSLLISSNTISFTSGVATMVDEVLVGALRSSSLFDTADTGAEYSYIQDFQEFTKDPETRLGRYNVRNGVITVIQPGEVYTPGSGLSGNLSLTASTFPQVPSFATDPIFNLPLELEPDLVNTLAALLRGV